MAALVKDVRLRRSETCGFGFSILGGAGSELPPIIYDIIEGSPAANSCQLAPGDIIWEVNGQEVVSFTTKEVLNCLRLSSTEVTLKLKTDASVQERVRQYLATPNNSEVLRAAITQDDLQGVKHIKAKKSASQTPPEQSSSTPPSLPSPTLSDASDRTSLSHGSNHTASENGFHSRDRTAAENERNSLKKPKSEAYLMTGDLILNLSRTSHDASWLPQQKTVDDLRKSGSSSVPTSPNEANVCGGRLVKRDLGSPLSLCSPVSIDNHASGAVKFTYPPAGSSVRISKSEDHLQYQKDGNMCAVNIELEDDVTSSLNTLLDTCDDPRSSPLPPPHEDRIIWTFNAPRTTSPDSVRSSHDSDSPLIRSPSPVSPQSPTSSMQYSCSGVYDKMCSGRDSMGSSNRSDNVCSNSSSLTSPDTDVPDELEWDDTTPTLHLSSPYTNTFGNKDLLPNGHGMATTEGGRASDKARARRVDENRIVIKVEGPDAAPGSRRRPQHLQKSADDPFPPQDEANRDPDLTPTNTRPTTPGSGTLSPDTLAYQELRESEDEITCLSEEDGTGKASSVRTSSTTSPPLSEDESDIDSLHSFHYSPKAVDIPSAVRLAKRLITLDGFKKSDVSRHLSKNRAVAEEYLNYFDFRGDTLDKALRKFLDRFCLAGETQERERVLVHFSHRFLECNPGTFNSQDAVHTLTCALMLLNTDLHGQNVGRKMTCNEFIDNLAELNDGENFPREVLKSLYHAIRNRPLQWAMDSEGDGEVTAGGKAGGSEPEMAVGSNPFLTPPSGSGVLYKKGYIMRKCCTDPNGKKTAFGKRSWKMWFCVIQDLVLYLHKDEQGARRGPQHAQLGHNALRLHHSLATRAHDYSKKEHVFRLQTADQAEYLLQTSDSKELQAWIDTINLVAASLSAAPLPGAVGSQRKFQRPLLPCSITKLNMSEQLEDHTKRLTQLEQELEDHKAHPPEKNSRAHSMSNYREKEAYLIKEVKRYRTYVYLLRSKLSTQSPGQQQQQQGGATGESGELPVFEVHPPGEEGQEGVERGGARVVPPPIPERARPSDSSCEEPEEMTETPSAGASREDKEDTSSLKKALERENLMEDEDSKSNKGTLKSKSKQEKEKRRLMKETERFLKEMEKREKEAEKKEKKKDQEQKEKEPDKQSKKQTEKQKKEEKLSQTNDEGLQEKEKAEETSQKQDSDTKKETEKPGEARMGTLNRLSALFKFSKLNWTSYACEEEEDDKESTSKSPKPPPLPPKPHPNSPVMKNLGTRIDI
ncbi:PH and SEC7 domain-containing protein-like isoform X3 [Eriocheir sinensis]|uniref:PH and SEC7 domain-containing protein-like isoform X3 n=1 Tax=Eriocheir sinensis TaxID=95602 RepID=UPI0021C8F4D2|nr:PH and SEC7 domain-containing protein-like isoform X3 [Eriocheir sinensis]